MHKIHFPNQLNTATFLKQYWQKKPLYMPQAWPDFDNPFSADELAGLALEADIPSKIVEQHSDDKWSVRQGPFTPADFAALEGKRWSLLITDIEKHLPDFMQYVQPFRFIPDWRFDDMMISYAPAGGSVGPHMDDYDTFLIQAQGQRNWQIEADFRALPQPPESLLQDTDLRLIKQFETAVEYECQAGDMLYLPPRLGHYGIAQNDCMTWSMGFKAPSFQQMLLDYAEDFEVENEHKRFTDPDLSLQQDAGEISQAQVQQLKNWFLQQINQDDEAFERWLGRLLSRDYIGAAMLDEAEVKRTIEPEKLFVELNAMLRFNFMSLKSLTKDQVYLAVAGEGWVVSKKLAKQLCAKSAVELDVKNAKDKHAVKSMLQKGFMFEC